MKFLVTTLSISLFLFTLSGCSSQETGPKAQEVTEESQTTVYEVDDEFIIQNNSIKVSGENFEISLPSEFEKRGEYIAFGPLGFVPEAPDDRQDFIYRISILPKRDIENVELNSDPDFITESPQKETVGNFETIRWAIGGMCEERVVEIIGSQNNIQFWSSGCHNEKEADFEYFENLIKDIK